MKARIIACAIALVAACAAQAQDKWVVGQSAPLTGGNAKFGNDIRDGAQAYFAMLNAKGGVQGRPIELVSLDDRNDRKQAGANAKTLLENRNLLALFGFASATLSLDAMPQAAGRRGAFLRAVLGRQPGAHQQPGAVHRARLVRRGDGEDPQLLGQPGLQARHRHALRRRGGQAEPGGGRRLPEEDQPGAAGAGREAQRAARQARGAGPAGAASPSSSSTRCCRARPRRCRRSWWAWAA